MTGGRATGLAIRVGAIVALVVLGLALALIAWQERIASGGPDPSADAATLAAIGGHLRLAALLLLVGIVAVVVMAALIMRALVASGERQAMIDQEAADEGAARSGGDLASANALPVPLARFGHLMSAGGLIRGFCHQLNNELGPVQGYAELLCGDARLSELHRRQVARIRDATKAALADIRGFGAALGWSNDPAQVTRLGDIAREAARSAQAALPARITVETTAGAEVEVTATEAEVGQVILHLCAAATPPLGQHDVAIHVLVDSIVGATSAAGEDVPVSGHRLEIWSDPVDPQRTKVQFGTLRPSWRYGRLRLEFSGHGWRRDSVGRMFDVAPSDEPGGETAIMALLGALMSETGGVIMVDTCPGKQTLVTLLWPARIAPEVGAPLELDAHEDELDALVIHASEAMAEELSRRLTDLGLRVASTTSSDAALDLVSEMGSRCHAVVLGQWAEDDFAARLVDRGASPRLFRLHGAPDEAELESLAENLREAAPAT